MFALLAVSAGWVAIAATAVRPNSAADWVTLAGGLFALPSLYLAWANYRDDRLASTADLGLSQIADQLAVAVRAQWAQEAEQRRLNDPYALPVRWEPVGSDLVADWESQIRLATYGAGWPPPPPNGWAGGPAELAGSNGDLHGLLSRIPTRRLIVLGEPGAGKSVFAVRLTLDLLAARSEGGPVPALFPLASWSPDQMALDDWLERQLVGNYPGLAEAAPSGATRARTLIDNGLILPVFDGLDEVPDAVRTRAIMRINDWLPPGQAFVLTSRTNAYKAAVAPTSGSSVRLAGAAGIRLRPLDPAVVADYLRDSAGGPADAARWDPVFAAEESPIVQALTTPLMASLARTIYNPRPGEPINAVGRSPVELLDSARFPTRTAVERHLFAAFIPAAYRPHSDPVHRRWLEHDVERWLIFLTRHQQGSPDLAWWRVPAAISPHRPWVPSFLVGMTAGLAVLLAVGLTAGPTIGLAFGLMFGLTVGHASGESWGARVPARRLRWNPRLGRVFGPAVGLTVTIVLYFAAGPAVGVTVGAAVGAATLILVSLQVTPADLAVADSPLLVSVNDRAAFRALVLSGGSAFALPVGITAGLSAGLAVGLASGLAVGLTVGFSRTAWGTFVLARAWLAARGRLPWRLMAFLSDAHAQGVLRQVGAVYQFRHVELQRRDHPAG